VLLALRVLPGPPRALLLVWPVWHAVRVCG